MRFTCRITIPLAGLLALSSVFGLLLGPRGWYDAGAQTFPALIGQDLMTLIVRSTLPDCLARRTCWPRSFNPGQRTQHDRAAA
jgi:hypothetical protein